MKWLVLPFTLCLSTDAIICPIHSRTNMQVIITTKNGKCISSRPLLSDGDQSLKSSCNESHVCRTLGPKAKNGTKALLDCDRRRWGPAYISVTIARSSERLKSYCSYSSIIVRCGCCACGENAAVHCCRFGVVGPGEDLTMVKALGSRDGVQRL